MSAELESKKFVWAYMIENGIETTGEWSYYGRRFEVSAELEYDYKKQEAARQALIAKVHSVGIDWDKTQAPTTDSHSSFEGTECPSSTTEVLIGVLVFKDGSTIKIGAKDEDGFSSYVQKLSKLAADRDRVARILGENG